MPTDPNVVPSPPIPADEDAPDYVHHGGGHHSHKHRHGGGHHHHKHHHGGGHEEHAHDADHHLHADHPDHEDTHHQDAS